MLFGCRQAAVRPRMAFNDKQARAKAQQIFDRFGRLIHDACANTGVRESFLAGFTGVEAGIDRNGQIMPNAKRFEKGVYHHLISVRDGLLHSYDNITRKDLAGMSDDAIRNLATSWGCTQIMGWHLIHNLKGTIEDLRDINQHFRYTVQLLKLVGGRYMRDGDLASVLHIWNTGHANGKTYHEDYVTNALKVAKFYEAINTGDPFNSAALPAAADPDAVTENAPAVIITANDGGDPNSAAKAADQTDQPMESRESTSVLTKLDAAGDKVQSINATAEKFQVPSLPAGLGTKLSVFWKQVILPILMMVWGQITGHWEVCVVVIVLMVAFGTYEWIENRKRNNPAGAMPLPATASPGFFARVKAVFVPPPAG
jgi:ketosteroid isomerase-like protein